MKRKSEDDSIIVSPNKKYKSSRHEKTINKRKRNYKKHKHIQQQYNHSDNTYDLDNHYDNYVTTKYRIPKRIREMVWNTHNGELYSNKCYVTWCNNIINVFNYQVGHDIPESKGGTYDLSNLKPICGNCNLSMSNKYTITEWNKLIPHHVKSNHQSTTQNIKSYITIMKTKYYENKIILKLLQKIETILELKK